MNVSLDEERHVYTVDGVVWPGVTRILAPISGYAGIPREVLDAKAALGRRVHLAVQYDAEDDLDDSTVTPDVRGYVDSWRRFRDAKQPKIIAAEQIVWHPMHRYCGKYDLVLEFDGARWMVDAKSCVQIMPAVGPQTAAYQQASGVESGITRRGALQLFPDGSMGKLLPLNDPNDWPTFLACLTVYRFKERHHER